MLNCFGSMRKCTLCITLIIVIIISVRVCEENMYTKISSGTEGEAQDIEILENDKQKQILCNIERKERIEPKENPSIPDIVNDPNVKISLTNSILNIRLSDMGKPVYLDEIINYYGCISVTIENGGVIMARDMVALENLPLQYLELHNILAVEEGILNHMPCLDTLKIILDEQYIGVIPLVDILENTKCANIIMLWNGEGEQGLLRGGDFCDRFYEEWEYVEAMISETGSSLQGIYRLNEENTSYTSFEFYKQSSDIHPCGAFISRRSGENNFDVLLIPEERLPDVYKGGRQRIYAGQDVNFDGYEDIIFVGKNSGIELYFGCITFLWDEQNQRYAISETAPQNFTRYNSEMEWLGFYYSKGSNESTYYIYEYAEDEFIEKRLELKFLEDEIVWYCFENNKLVKTLKLYYDNGNSDYAVYIEGDAIVEEDLKEDYWSMGQKYFPEFDLQAPVG